MHFASVCLWQFSGTQWHCREARHGMLGTEDKKTTRFWSFWSQFCLLTFGWWMINNKIDVLKYFDHGLRLHFGYPSLDYQQKVPADWSTHQVCQLPHFRPPSQPNLPGPSWFSGILSLEYTALLCMKGSCFYWSLSLWHPKWCSRITSAKKSDVTGHDIGLH